MTCIVAIKHGGKVYMGADSAGANDWLSIARADRKIYRVGEMLIGFTTSFRMGQLLGYSLTLPKHDEGVDDDRYMRTSFIDAVRQCLKDGGYARKENEAESGGYFIVAYRGEIYTVYENYDVGVQADDYAACGSGYLVAMGSLFSTSNNVDTPKWRLMTALEAAAHFATGVRGPFFMSET